MTIRSSLDITQLRQKQLWVFISITIVCIAMVIILLRHPARTRTVLDKSTSHQQQANPITLHFQEDDMAAWTAHANTRMQQLIKQQAHLQSILLVQQHALTQLTQKNHAQQSEWAAWQLQVERMLTQSLSVNSRQNRMKKQHAHAKNAAPVGRGLADSVPEQPAHGRDALDAMPLQDDALDDPLPGSQGDKQAEKKPMTANTALSADLSAKQVTGLMPTTQGTDGVFRSQPHREGKKGKKRASKKWHGWLPAGGFFHGTLLTGIEAGTGSHTQMNPQPVLIRVDGDAILPNAARYALRACFVLGSAYGSASSERAYIRTTRISCVSARYHAVLVAQLQGFVVDADGKLGLRGRMINRQGVKLAKAMLAGFFSGVANMTTTASHIADSALKKSSSEMIPLGRAMRVVGLSGADNVAKALMRFYLDEAKRLFPVIEVGAGRHVLINVSRGVSLVWQPV